MHYDIFNFFLYPEQSFNIIIFVLYKTTLAEILYIHVLHLIWNGKHAGTASIYIYPLFVYKPILHLFVDNLTLN